jgi:hypothetical protein
MVCRITTSASILPGDKLLVDFAIEDVAESCGHRDWDAGISLLESVGGGLVARRWAAGPHDEILLLPGQRMELIHRLRVRRRAR